jgi:hypothetical protein
MNNNYSSLKIVAKIFEILGWIQILIGTIIIVVVCNLNYQQVQSDIPQNTWALIMSIGGIVFFTFIAFIVCFAISKFILLCVNTAIRIETMDNNLLCIAEMKEKEMKNKI